MWLGLGFILASLLATTVVPSLPEPFAFFPLMLVCGVLVMNRSGVVQGAMWLVLSGVVLGGAGTAPGRVLAYVIAAAVGLVLADRVFANRSVYALVGLGTTTCVVFVTAAWLSRVITGWLGNASVRGMSAHEALWTLLLLVVGLYIGFVLAVALRRFFGKRFLVR